MSYKVRWLEYPAYKNSAKRSGMMGHDPSPFSSPREQDLRGGAASGSRGSAAAGPSSSGCQSDIRSVEADIFKVASNVQQLKV